MQFIYLVKICATNDTQEVKDMAYLDNFGHFSLGFLDKPFLLEILQVHGQEHIFKEAGLY